MDIGDTVKEVTVRRFEEEQDALGQLPGTQAIFFGINSVSIA